MTEEGKTVEPEATTATTTETTAETTAAATTETTTAATTAATYEIAEPSPCVRKISIHVSKDALAGKVNENFTELSKTVQEPGFRKGKIPRKLLEKKYLTEVRRNSRMDLVRDAFDKAKKEISVDIYRENDVDDSVFEQDDDELKLEVEVEIVPKFDLPAYKGVEVEQEKAEVSEENIANVLKGIRSKEGTIETVDEKIDDEHTFITDLKYFIDDKEHAVEENASCTLAGDHPMGLHLHELWAEALRGKGSGDEVEIPMSKKLVSDHDKDASGGKLVVKIYEVKKRIAPEVDEAWLKENDFENLDEFKEQIRKELTFRAEEAQKSKVSRDVFAKLLDQCQFELPPSVMEADKKDFLHHELFHKHDHAHGHEGHEHDHDMDDHSLDDVSEEKKQKAEAKYLEALSERVRDLREPFLVDAIAKDARIFATEEDVSREISALSYLWGISPQQTVEVVTSRGMIPMLRESCRKRKVMEFLREKAKISTVDSAKESKSEG
ncbi:MAG: trigger factor [Planctomycetes bacterium]|nr:trigger factor [Planctomycetota bacterium]